MSDSTLSSTSSSNVSPAQSTAWTLLMWCAVILFRILVGYQPYSGQDNHHGAPGAYGGDYEAQRHWMELTYNLPRISQWYTYDLEYWGLDYPPLSAYQSWLCGALSHHLIGPETVALDDSRGFESATHKAFMRFTVLFLDLALYGSAVYRISHAVFGSLSIHQRVKSACLFLTAMLQPALVLVDHGHFQYNTTALGLALWAFYHCSQNRGVLASILFACALSFKQMTLYYAPAIFAFLLGTCFGATNNNKDKSTANSNKQTNDSHSTMDFSWKRFWSYGTAVIFTFVVVWSPVILVNDPATSALSRLKHILHRIFPLQRGLFEDKVANLWFVSSLKPLQLPQRFLATSMQPVAALLVTLLLCLPACVVLFQLGQQQSQKQQSKRDSVVKNADTLSTLLLGAGCTALSFFLGSFHVHEKSILLALAPASLSLVTRDNNNNNNHQIRNQDFLFLDWFAVVATFSLWPLLVLDRLQVAYVCTLVMYLCWRQLRKIALLAIGDSSNQQSKRFSWMETMVILGSATCMIGLHWAYIVVKAPSQWPDLFPVLWSVLNCGFFVLCWLGMTWKLYNRPTDTNSVRLKSD